VRWLDDPSADASAPAGPAGPGRDSIESPDPTETDGPTELDAIVAAVVDAHRRSGSDASPIRRPWLDPLPADVRLTDLAPGCVALADDPDAQRRLAVGWDRRRGGLLVLGATGTGRSTALVTVALDLARVHAPDALHLYALDMGAGALAPLAALPQCAAVVGADEIERRRRLIRRLRGELDRRRAASGRCAEIVLLVDGYGALVAAHDDPAGYELLDDLERIIVDGPQVGITMAAAAERAAAVPSVVAATITQKWVLRLADRADASLAGVTEPPGPGAPPGRAAAAGIGLELQIAWTGPDRATAVAAIAATWPEGDEGRPAPITTLPHCVRLAALPVATGATRPWLVPVGIGDRHLAPVSLALHPGDHVLVSGPSRAGRSNALALLARQVRAARPDALVIGVVARRSPLHGHPALDVELASVDGLAAVLAGSGAARPAIVLVDDADLVDDAPRVLVDVVTGGYGPDVHVVAAGRSEGLRAAYGHWTQLVRRSRLGVLLRPQPDLDGDLLGVTLPRREAVAPVAGRGYLVADGAFELVQLALADPAGEGG
jgi:S-DNA-T family DNA segregation ATPase FtsK/SpoIIIE